MNNTTPILTRLTVKLTPKGGRDAVEGWKKDADGKPLLAARVAAPPENGKANRALIALLAGHLDIARGKIRLVSGAASRRKILEIEGGKDVLARLNLGAAS